MVNSGVLLLGMFMVLRACVDGSDSMMGAVSEGYSHYDSATTLYSSDNYLKCTSDQQVTVSSTQEISDLIKALHGQPLKIRATRRGFHSSKGFVCAGKRGSSYAEHNKLVGTGQVASITVLLHRMNRVVAVDGGQHRLTVEAGMTLRELALAAEANSMAVPVGALSLYANLTVGGVILASAHGSGYRTTSSLGDLVRKVKWANAKGEIIVSDVGTELGAREVRALVGGLGLLGIVTEITLQLGPNSRTIVEVRKGLDDAAMAGELKKTLQEETPHVIAFWRPDFGKHTKVMFKPVEEGEYDPTMMPKFYPNGSIALLVPTDAQAASAVKAVMAAWEDDVRDESPSADVLNSEVCAFGEAALNASIFEDGNGTLVDYATIPTNYAFVSRDCVPRCSFDVHYAGVFTEDAEFTIKLSDFESWVSDVKRIVRTELAESDACLRKRYSNSTITRCMSPGYFVLRFGQGNQNLLSTSTGSEDVVYVQFSNSHSAFVPTKLSKVSAIVETIEQLTLCKYGGRPHWGKNHERVVRHPMCKVRDNFPAANIAELLEMQRQHDPRKIFEPELYGTLLQRRGPDYSPLCALRYWCYCAADSHCPSGFQCRASASFADYKTCRLAKPC